MEEKPFHPLDRGWAWMVVLGCTLSIFLMGGTLRTFGIIMEEISKYFEIPNSVSILVITVESVGYTVASSVGVILGERFGARIVVLVGAVIGSAGVALSCLLINITYVICTAGIGLGLANGLLHGNGFVMVSRYFEKRRAFATGLAVAGGSIGQFIMPPILQFLLNTFSLSGTLLIVGGLYLNLMITGMLYRPITFYNYRKNRLQSEVEAGDCTQKEELKPLTEGDDDLTTNAQSKMESLQKFGCLQKIDSSRKFGSLQKLGPSQDFGSVQKLESSKKFGSLQILETSKKLSPSADNLTNHGDNFPGLRSKFINKHIDHLKVPGMGGCQTSVSAYTSMEDIVSASIVSLTHIDDDKVVTTPTSDKKPSVCSRCWTSLGKLTSLFDFSLLKNLPFLYYTFTMTLNFLGYFNVLFFIPAFAISRQFSPYQAAFLVSINGICDLVGRVGCGWFADLNLVQQYKVLTVVMLTNGLNSIILPFSSEYWWLAIHCGIYGCTSGANLPFLPVLTVDLFGLDLLPRALALLLFTSGAAGAVEQPLLGLLADFTGSLDFVFYLSGGIALTGAILTVLLPLVVKREQKDKPEVLVDGEQAKVTSPDSADVKNVKED